MPVKKVELQPEETDIQYENTIKQDDRIERFTVKSLDNQISKHEQRIVNTQAEIARLTAVKQEAMALR